MDTEHASNLTQEIKGKHILKETKEKQVVLNKEHCNLLDKPHDKGTGHESKIRSAFLKFN